MNDEFRKQALQKQVESKFKGKQTLQSRVKPIYPEGAERELQRISWAYLRLVNEVVRKYMPAIRKAAAAERENNRRQDDSGDLMQAIQKAFQSMGEELERKTSSFGLRKKLEDLANLTRKLSIQEWKRTVHETLGLDIMDDYYLGEFYRQALQEWIDQNVSLIKSIPQEALSEMHSIVSQGFKTGATLTSIEKEIRNTYHVKRSSAKLLARDQIAKLNGQLTKQQQTDAGVNEYIWSTSGDSRVRETHKKLDGKKFRWDDPPVVTPPGKPVRRCHPGEDYQCRCVALPVFDISTVDVPASGRTKGGV